MNNKILEIDYRKKYFQMIFNLKIISKNFNLQT